VNFANDGQLVFVIVIVMTGWLIYYVEIVKWMFLLPASVSHSSRYQHV